MAVDKMVTGFVILCSVGCIVRYGSCAPIEDRIVLDNGTVLTMKVNEVQEAPPPRYESALDASSKDEENPVIVIHEAQYAPPPHVIAKRSADPSDGEDDNSNVVIYEPQTPPPRRSESAQESPEINTLSVVKDGVQFTTVIDKSEQPKSENQGNDDIQPVGNGGNVGKDNAGEDKGRDGIAPTAIPVISISKGDDSGNNDSQDAKGETGGVADDKKDNDTQGDTDGVADDKKDKDTQGDTDGVADDKKDKDTQGDTGGVADDKKDKDTQGDTDGVSAADGKGTKGNSADDKSVKTEDKLSGENILPVTPAGEIPNEKLPTESKESDDGDIADNGLPGDNESKDEDIAKPPSAAEPTDDEKDDHAFDDNISFGVDGNDNKDDVEEEEEEYEDDDDTNTDQNPKEKIFFEEDGEGNEDGDDDDPLDENYSKGKPAISGEISESERSSSSKQDVSESQGSGHFMSYFLISVVFVACFYLVFHNRQKIKAYVLEGMTGRGRRRKAGNSEYRQLTTAEEVLPSADKEMESQTTYTY